MKKALTVLAVASLASATQTKQQASKQASKECKMATASFS